MFTARHDNTEPHHQISDGDRLAPPGDALKGDHKDLTRC
jgi:hypothetical protein